ncbi:hypothetical protein GCM10027415_22960 [Humibacter ginsengisoli]
MNRAIFDHAKIVYVFEGNARVETERGIVDMREGDALALGAGAWCSVRPLPQIRMWTLYVDEPLLRNQMNWLLPNPDRVQPGVHPSEWTGGPLLLRPGMAVLLRVEPLFRQVSVLRDGSVEPEVATVRALALLLRATEMLLPVLLDARRFPLAPVADGFPIRGTLTSAASVGHVGRAVQHLRQNLAHQWNVDLLSRSVSLSRTHLTRQFTSLVGLPPMRFLNEVRLTEFTRLIEETDETIEAAARAVGWTDARVAAAWFRRRFGISPSHYRSHPHPFKHGRTTDGQSSGQPTP